MTTPKDRLKAIAEDIIKRANKSINPAHRLLYRDYCVLQSEIESALRQVVKEAATTVESLKPESLLVPGLHNQMKRAGAAIREMFGIKL